MTRPRHEPIDLAASPEEAAELLSRRRLLGLAGAGGASLLAGCGGGPGGGGGGDGEAPAETESATPAAGGPTVVDRWFRDLTTTNLEKFTPNVWHPENGWIPPWQELPLAMVPETAQAPGGGKDATSIILLGSASDITFEPENRLVTWGIHEDLTWSDGTPFDAENVRAHWDLMEAQISLGEQPVNVLPESVDVVDEHTLEVKLLPGSPALRLYLTLFHGNANQTHNTHPKFHAEWIEGAREATTQNETKAVIQGLVGTQFPQDRLSDLALGPVKATNWDPSQITLESRMDFPWGLEEREVTRIFKGVRMEATTGENLQNAAIGGKRDFHKVSPREAFKRFPESWEMYRASESTGTNMYFSPKHWMGKPNEDARKVRKALAYLMDPVEMAQVNDLLPAYEKSAAFYRKADFENWLGDVFDQFTNYGLRDQPKSERVDTEKAFALFREVGLERNRSGTWIRPNGEPFAPTVTLEGPNQVKNPAQGRPTMNNVPQQLNRHGIQATGKFLEGDPFENNVRNYESELFVIDQQSEVHPHPFFGYREDVGLGSPELTTEITSWDWRNGIRRVKVPMPVGDQDGELATYDWDRNVKEMLFLETEEAVTERVVELSWVLNQWVPGILLLGQTFYPALNLDRVKPHADWKPEHIPEADVEEGYLLGAGFWQPA